MNLDYFTLKEAMMFLIGIGYGLGWCCAMWLNYELKKKKDGCD